MLPLLFRCTFFMVFISILVGCHNIHPNPPSLADTPPQPVALPESRVDLLVHVPLDRVKQEIEQAVQPSFGVGDYNESINGGADHCCEGHSAAHGVSAGWAVSRGPFSVTATGNTINLGVDVLYDLEGRFRAPCCGWLCPSSCVGPLLYGSCGRHGQSRRRAHLWLNSTVQLQSDWTLRSQSSGGASPIDRCEVTLADVDITDNIMAAAGRVVNGAGARIDNAVAVLPVRAKAEDAWRLLQQPIQVASGIWLESLLTGAVAQPLTQMGTDLIAGISLRAKPRIVVSATAPPATPSPLPPLQTGTVGDTFSIALAVDLPFTEATQQAKKALHIDNGGFRYPAVGEPHIVVDDIEVYGAGTAAVVRASIHGSARGQLYLVGKPEYVQATDTIIFKDLDYSVETRSIIVKVADWLLHSQFKDELASRAKFSIRNRINNVKNDLNAALTRQVGPLHVTGSLADLRVLSVNALSVDKLFQAQVLFGGTLNGVIQ